MNGVSKGDISEECLLPERLKAWLNNSLSLKYLGALYVMIFMSV